jgi:hypothetical protein
MGKSRLELFLGNMLQDVISLKPNVISAAIWKWCAFGRCLMSGFYMLLSFYLKVSESKINLWVTILTMLQRYLTWFILFFK